jgi:hypothetical protein
MANLQPWVPKVHSEVERRIAERLGANRIYVLRLANPELYRVRKFYSKFHGVSKVL